MSSDPSITGKELTLAAHPSHRDKGDRDVFNEKPTRDEQTVAAAEPVKGAGSSGTQAVIHTTKGDIVSQTCYLRLMKY